MIRPSGMLFHPATVHHEEQTRSDRTNGCLFAEDSFLHPESFGAMRYSFSNNRKTVFRLPEAIHKIECARHGGERWNGRLAEDVRLVRIHPNDPIALTLHIGRHAIRRARRIQG